MMRLFPFNNTLTQKGFTLIELIAVLVVLGVLSAIGSDFLVSTVNSYNQVQARSKIINRGRLVIEQMTRQVRIALPNSVRVSATGNCVEVLPVVSGASYLNDVPDTENMAAPVTSINTAPFSLGLGSANHVSIGALNTAEIYATGSPSGRVDIGALGAGPIYTAVPLAASHRFDRNSITRRVFIADDPLRFCLIASTLFEYSGYGLSTAALTDIPPGGVSPSIMAENVSTGTQAFILSQGSEDVNTSLDISLSFTLGGEQVTLNQQVLVRNVP